MSPKSHGQVHGQVICSIRTAPSDRSDETPTDQESDRSTDRYGQVWSIEGGWGGVVRRTPPTHNPLNDARQRHPSNFKSNRL